MFDLAVLANPARLKREFLAVNDVAEQAMPKELAREFDQLREENPDVRIGGSFWWDFIMTYRSHLAILTASRAINTLLILGAVLLSQDILDEGNTLTDAVWLLVGFTVIQLTMRLVNAWSAVLQSQLLVCTRTFVTLRMNVKLLRMGQLASNEFSTGNLKTLISSDIYRVGDFLHAIFRNGVPCLLGLFILGPVIVDFMGVPGLIAMVVGFGAMPLAFYLGGYVHRKEELIKTEEDRLATMIGEWVTNVRLLRFLGWEALMRTRVAARIRALVIESTKQHGVNLLNFGVSVSWWLFPIIALIWANEALGENRELVTLFASIWMLNHITLYIRWLPDIFISYASAAACVSRLDKLFQHRDIADDLEAETESDVATAKPVRLHLNGVTFTYEGEAKPAIDNLYLSVALDERVSLIGRVGSGKSTLLKLMTAEIKPGSGTIQVEFDNGVIADLWHANVYRRFRECVAYMPQEAYLSNASFAVNVALSTGVDESDVMHAVQMAELEADIAQFEGGINEEVGETGVNLSGGQKQRVNLARALHSNRDYLVLDDPLSAVDTETEGRLMETLIRATRGFVLSTHRLMVLEATDRLLVLEAGRVVEDGNPAALMRDPTSEFSQHLRAGEIEENEEAFS